MDENNNEFSALGKDINNTLYSEDRASRVAKELGYSTIGEMNKMVQGIRQEMLEGNELVLINTGTEVEILDADTALSTGNIDDSTVFTNEADFNEFLSLKTALKEDDSDLEVDIRVSGTEQLKTMLNDKGYELNDSQFDTLSKALRTSPTNYSDKVFKLTTGAVNIGAKTGKLVTKTGGKLVRFGRNLNLMDAEGKVNAVQSGTNQLKTFAKWSGRNFLLKPLRYVGRKSSKKITKKPIQSISRKIDKRVTKITAKLSKMTAKKTSKLLQVLVRTLARIIKWLITAIISSLPFFIIFLVIVIVIVIILSVFGGNMKDEQLEKYASYMNNVQTEFQEKTKNYYDDGYKVDGTYNGVAYINWQAALSVMQILQPELDASKSEFDLLNEMKADKVMYKIEETTTDEYVRKSKEIDSTLSSDIFSSNKYKMSFTIDNGYSLESFTFDGVNVSLNELSAIGNKYTYEFTDNDSTKAKKHIGKATEVIKTTKKYVVTVGTLEDYKNWIKNNTSSIKAFYDKEKVSYDSNTSSFLTSNLSEEIDTLYNSEDFSMLLEDAGISMGNGSGGGEIYDTGEHKGVLAYPTTYRTISAGFPTYPSGKQHTGIDFPAPNNTPICACADGVVILTKELTYSYGRYIVIQHNINGQTLYTLYAHNTTLYVKAGDTVKQGQHIADSGSTGNSTGPHCHLSVLTSWSPQVYVQPLNYL